MNKRKTGMFSKPDEMEVMISYRAMRLTWIIINITFIGVAIVFLISGGLNPLSALALVVAEGVYFIIKGILSWQMTHGGKDTE